MIHTFVVDCERVVAAGLLGLALGLGYRFLTRRKTK
jgi:hypothetical protein